METFIIENTTHGGKYFTFFEPVFNIADMAISTGFGLLIVFNKKAFAK